MSKAKCAPTSARPAATNSMYRDVKVLQRVSENDPYPISLKEHGVDFLMEHRHLWVRTPRQAAILRVRAEIIKAARDFFDENGFTLTDPPILTPAACEGTSTLFPVDYFDEQAYLTQSGSSTSKPRRWLWARSTHSGRPSARKNRRPAATSPSSGWLSPKSPTPNSTISWTWPKGSSLIVKRCLDKRRADLQTIGRDVAKLERSWRRSLASATTKPSRCYRRPRQGRVGEQIRMGRRSWLARRDLHLIAVRQAGHGAPLSRRR